MKISCHTPLFTLKGDPITHPDGTKATFKTVACEVLLNRHNDDNDAQAVYKSYKLADKIHHADFVDLSVEELALIKTRVGKEKYSSALIVGRMFDILEGKTLTDCDKKKEGAADVVELKQPGE